MSYWHIFFQASLPRIDERLQGFDKIGVMFGAIDRTMDNDFPRVWFMARCYRPGKCIGAIGHGETHTAVNDLPVYGKFAPDTVNIRAIVIFNVKYLVNIGAVLIELVHSELLQYFRFSLNVCDSIKFHGKSRLCNNTGERVLF